MSTAATASMPGDLSGAIVDHLRQLNQSGRAVIAWAKTTVVGPTAGRFQRAAAHIQLTLVANGAMRNVVKSTSTGLETLIWLRGLKATIEDSNDEMAASIGDLLPEVEALQETMESLRSTVVELKESIAGVTKSPALRAQRIALFHRYLATEKECYAVLEAARWAVLEREADNDVKHGRVGPTYSSAADLLASLGD